MIEAVNENRADCFGWALEEVLEEEGLIRVKPDHCVHHHKNKGNLVGKGKHSESKLWPCSVPKRVSPAQIWFRGLWATLLWWSKAFLLNHRVVTYAFSSDHGDWPFTG